MLGQQFYHETIRKIIVGFGTTFNNVQLIRKDSSGNTVQSMKVPLAYGPKEKFLVRLRADADLSSKVAITLPRIGFEIQNLSYDAARKLSRVQKFKKVKGDTSRQLDTQFMPVPYNLEIVLYVLAKQSDDALQIVEQILPYFNPNFNVTLNLNSIHSKVDVPINLNAVQVMEDYVGDFQTRRSVQSVFSFTAKSYVYGPITTSKPIEGVTIDVINGFKYSSIGATQTARIEITGDYATGSSGGVVYDVTGTA